MCAVLNNAAFCISLISSFPNVLFRYFQNNFGMVRVATFFTGIADRLIIGATASISKSFRKNLFNILLLLSSSSSSSSSSHHQVQCIFAGSEVYSQIQGRVFVANRLFQKGSSFIPSKGWLPCI